MIMRATENVVAGHIWHAGRYLPTPALDQCSTTAVTRHTGVPRDDAWFSAAQLHLKL